MRYFFMVFSFAFDLRDVPSGHATEPCLTIELQRRSPTRPVPGRAS